MNRANLIYSMGEDRSNDSGGPDPLSALSALTRLHLRSICCQLSLAMNLSTYLAAAVP